VTTVEPAGGEVTYLGAEFPGDKEVRAVLARSLDRPSLRIVGRRRNTFLSTLPTEIVDVADDSGFEATLFAKYYLKDDTDYGRPLRGDVEAAVYEHVLPLTGLPHARFAASRVVDGSLWLFTQCVTGWRVNKSPDSAEALTAAASWIGAFHAALASDGAPIRFPFLEVYDDAFLAGLGARAAESNPYLLDTDWYERTVDALRSSIGGLLRDQLTVIHGEYYPKNILIDGATALPVDWETAAIGPGILDIAMLSENWGTAIASRAEAAYCRARYGTAQPRGWADSVLTARVVIGLHWIARFELPPDHRYVEKLSRDARAARLV
jgi:hypothetical protein